MSSLPTVAVIVGAPIEPHLTPVNVAVVAVPEAGCLSNKVNDLPAVAVGMVNVQAVADVKVAVKIVPAVIAKVADAPTVPLAVMVSVYATVVIVPLNSVVLVAPDTLEPMAMAVVEPLRPAVPMLTVLVLPESVAPEAKLIVPDAVLTPKVLFELVNELLPLNVFALIFCEEMVSTRVDAPAEPGGIVYATVVPVVNPLN